MSSRFQFVVCAALAFVPFGLPSHVLAQAEVDPEIRIERLENQLRTLTGQNEELQYRNRQLEEQLRALQGGQQPPQQQQAAPRQAPPQQQTYQQPPVQQAPVQQPNYNSPAAAPPVIAAPVPGGSGRRGDAFDPNQNPNAPGVPRALGGGQMPVANNAPVNEQPVGAPGGRNPGEPLNLSGVGGTDPNAAQVQPRGGNASASLSTLPPSQTPRDEFDLGLGYIQRKDYALAEETMRNFATKYPSDPLVSQAQYWLGESLFQRQQYREAAEAFLGVTTKYDTSAKAPDALLRLGQSLAALKEKEAACAAFGEVVRKYPKASNGVKQGVGREQKRVGC